MSNRQFCFTIDDNIRFFEEAVTHGFPSIFEADYPAALLRLHQKYGCKIQLNTYYSISRILSKSWTRLFRGSRKTAIIRYS